MERGLVGLGWRVLGLGVMALGVATLVLGDFLPGQPAPKDLPGRAALALGAGGFMLIAGAAMQWRRTAGWAAAAIGLYWGLIVVVLMDGRLILRNLGVYGAYSGAAEQVAIAASAMMVWASTASIDAARRELLTRIGRLAFGVCAVLFGGAHFVYMNLTAPLVPKWLPPSGEFWGYATGVAHIAGGLAILSGVQARLAAILLTVMYASFTPLVHLPRLLGGATDAMTLSENAINVALAGAAWVVADSLRREEGGPS